MNQMRGCLLVLGVVCSFVFPAQAYAEVLELEGTVTAVDATARSITIERKTPKGTKTLELEVTKKAGDLSSVKAGDSISFSYDPDLELVTKFGGGTKSPSGNDEMAEVIAIQELDAAGNEDQPWVTPDGLTIFWTTQKPGERKQVWSASRTSPQLLFGNKRQVTIGQDNTFSADGLEGIVFLPQEGQGNLCVVKRSNISEAFSRPAVMQDFPSLADHQVYACGAPIVVDSARRDFVAQCGLPEDEFFADSFTSAADVADPVS